MFVPRLKEFIEKRTGRKARPAPPVILQCAIGRIVSLSQDGMCIEVRRNRQVTCGKTVAITLEGCDMVVAVRATGIWSDEPADGEPHYRVVFRFEGLSQMTADLIATMIKRTKGRL